MGDWLVLDLDIGMVLVTNWFWPALLSSSPELTSLTVFICRIDDYDDDVVDDDDLDDEVLGW